MCEHKYLEQVKKSICTLVSLLGVLLHEEQCRGFKWEASVFEGESMCLLSAVSRAHIGVCQRWGGPGDPQPSPGSSKLLARLVPGHLGSARALWCAGEKWQC